MVSKNYYKLAYYNFVKQSKAKQSKAKQSKAKPVLYILTNNYFKFLFQKYFLTLIKFNFDILLNKNFSFIVNKFKLKNYLAFVNFQRFSIKIFVYLNTIYKIY